MRLIDADALLENAKKYVYQSDMTTTIALGIAETWIKDAPTVDAAPVVHGYIQDSYVGPICSVCGVPIRLDHETPDWCPRCGAALDGGETNADG